jgi:hypothetical protein
VLSELRGLSKQAEEFATKSVPRCDGCFRTPCCAGEARRTSQTQSIRRRRVRLSRKRQGLRMIKELLSRLRFFLWPRSSGELDKELQFLAEQSTQATMAAEPPVVSVALTRFY